MTFRATITLFCLIFICLPPLLAGEALAVVTVWLKNGGKLVVDRVWEKKGQLVCETGNSRVALDYRFIADIQLGSVGGAPSTLPFSFDIWSSGQTENQVLATANNSQLRMRSIDDHAGQNKIRYSYSNSFLGRDVRVDLYFTPKTRLLYMINLRGTESNRPGSKSTFFDEIKVSLIKQYDVLPVLDKEAMELYGGQKEVLVWRVKDNVRITLDRMISTITVTLLDERLDRAGQLERLDMGR